MTASSDGAAPDVPTEQDGALIEAMFAALYPEDGVWYLDVMRERQRVHERLSAALAVARPVIAAERQDQIADAAKADPGLNGYGCLERALRVIEALPLTEETS